MNQAQIDTIMNEEYGKFNSELFKAADIPVWFPGILKRALMTKNMRDKEIVQLPFKYLQDLIKKEPKEYTNFDVCNACNLISTTPFKDLYQSSDEALKKSVSVLKVIETYKFIINEVNVAMKRKIDLLTGGKQTAPVKSMLIN